MSRPETDPALSDHDQLFLFLSDALPVADSPSSFSLRHPESSDRDRDQNRIQAETMTENKTHVILLSCGSFNPITRGHVHMFGEEGGGGDQSKPHVYTLVVTWLSRTFTRSDSVSNIGEFDRKGALRYISWRYRVRERYPGNTPSPTATAASHHPPTKAEARP